MNIGMLWHVRYMRVYISTHTHREKLYAVRYSCSIRYVYHRTDNSVLARSLDNLPHVDKVLAETSGRGLAAGNTKPAQRIGTDSKPK